MKTLINSLGIVLLLITISCNDFLDVNPKSETTVSNTFNTDQDFNNAINGVYNDFQDFYDYFWEFGDLRGDDATQLAQRAQELVNIDNFSSDPNADYVDNAWSNLYTVIADANTILSKINEADASIITNRDQYKGELKFLRALAYFNLVRIFGDVPMVTTPLTSKAALETPQTDVDTIYDEVIIKDLHEAEANLPETYSSADIGRATKGAAKSILGKVYLTRHNFTQAESKLKEVTKMGYALLDDYKDLFDFDNEHHSEYIFDIEYIDGNIGLGSSFTRVFNVEDQDVGRPLVDALIEVYNYKGSRGGGGSGSPSKAFLDLFDPNDLRKDRTARTGITDLEGNRVEPIPGRLVTSFTLKYAEHGFNLADPDGKANWRVIRYADVLLMLAEALNENGKTDKALVYLNKVHKRAGLEEYSGLSKEETRAKIYKERRLELYMEGQRWFDLVRTGRALNVMEKYGMEDYNTVFPIPQSQIEVVNDPSILAQNPGY